MNEGFESGTLGLFSSTGTPGWITTTTNTHTGSYAVYAPDTGSVTDLRLTLSNPLPMPSQAEQVTLDFFQKYDFEAGANGIAYDGGLIEASTDGGASWSHPFIIQGGYNAVLYDCPSQNPLAGQAVWSGAQSAWQEVEVDLNPYLGRSVLFRFRMGTDQTGAAGGWWIDDISVNLSNQYCYSPTATNTSTPTTSPTRTPTICGACGDYVVIPTTSATIVPGTFDIGNHCDDCTTAINLPFTFDLYCVNMNGAIASPNGNLQFFSVAPTNNHVCLPYNSFIFAILPLWTDLRTDISGTVPSGIYTSVSGVAPNRIFNIEWRAVYNTSCCVPVNFEVRLYEGLSQFDIIHANVESVNYNSTVGVQFDRGSQYTQYTCNQGILRNGTKLTFRPYMCGEPTFTATATATNTPPTPPPPTRSWTATRTSTVTNTPNPNAHQVTILNFTYQPNPLTVVAGETVRWTNMDASTHTSTGDLWDSGPLTLGQFFEYTFTSAQAGTHPYHCSIHSFMTGTILVVPAEVTATYTNTPTTTATVTRTSTRTPTIANSPTNTRLPTFTATLTSTPCAIPFTDVFPTDYYYNGVRWLYCRGAISGYADHTFRPANITTRAQVCKIVVLTYGWVIYTPPTQTFIDVPTTHPFYTYIETAYHAGIVSGYSCGTNCLEFRPYNNITRAQLAKVVVLAAGWSTLPLWTPTFRDVPTTHPFFEYIEAAYCHQVISGYSCGTGCLEFRPDGNATRGQVAKMVYNAVLNLTCSPP